MIRTDELRSIEEQASIFYKANAESMVDDGVKRIFSALFIISNANIDMIKSLDMSKGIDEVITKDPSISLFACLEECECANITTKELNIYVEGSDMEKKLISLYEEASSAINDEKSLSVIDKIVKNHKDALFILSDMIKHLNRPSEWVESAEFTLREPY